MNDSIPTAYFWSISVENHIKGQDLDISSVFCEQKDRKLNDKMHNENKLLLANEAVRTE